MRNIVYLDPDAAESVLQLYDQDIIGMPISIGQCLMHVWNTFTPGRFRTGDAVMADPIWYPWAMASKNNYTELWNYGMDIMDEHWHRFGSRNAHPYRHGYSKLFDQLQYVPKLPDVEMTPLPRTVEDMRAGYPEMTGFWVQFTHRPTPDWLK